MDASAPAVARRAASRLAAELGSSLPALTERVLIEDGEPRRTRSYDPGTAIAVASLLVSAKGGHKLGRRHRVDRVAHSPQGALWLFMVFAQANRSYLLGALDEAEAEYDAIRKALEKTGSQTARRRLATVYHQLGTVSKDRGDLSGAESWYRKSLEIKESLGNRPGMAMTYGQLGLLAEAGGDVVGSLDWTVRCVALFLEFPHPSTGPGPHHLARLTGLLGRGVLEESWQRCTSKPLPEAVRSWVEARLAENESS